jgi:hypothetical protein
VGLVCDPKKLVRVMIARPRVTGVLQPEEGRRRPVGGQGWTATRKEEHEEDDGGIVQYLCCAMGDPYKIPQQ